MNIKMKHSSTAGIMGLLLTTSAFSAETPHPAISVAPGDLANYQANLADQYCQQLEMILTVITTLKETNELKCASPEDAKLVEEIKHKIEQTLNDHKRLPSALAEVGLRRTHAVACMLRSIVQLYGFSSPALDVAKGITAQEETYCIICELQKCLATRNITSMHRVVRSWTDKLDPYRHVITAAMFPIAALAAYTALGMLRNQYISVASGSRKGPDGSAAAKESWDTFAKATLIPGAALAYGYANSTFKDALEKISDGVKKLAAQVRGLPFKGSNPASTSKVPLKVVPTPRYARAHMEAIARMVLNQEEVYLQGGGTGMKTILIDGDVTLAHLLATGLAHEITRLAKENKKDLVCPIATIHLSKLTEEGVLKKELEKIMRYNKSCVIVLQDLDFVIDEGDQSMAVAQIINGIKSVTKLHENYIVVGTAREFNNVNASLKAVFGTKLGIHPAGDKELVNACFTRAHEVYGITITNPELREQLARYLCATSFTDFLNLFSAAFTKALPQIASCPLSEEGVERELTLATGHRTHHVEADNSAAAAA